MSGYGYGNGYGYGDCYKPCCGPPCGPKLCPTNPPAIGGTWNVTLTQLVRPAGPTGISCSNLADITSAQQFQWTVQQCGNPQFAIIDVASGPTGNTGPYGVGDQLVGTFNKSNRNCWELEVPSSIDNSVLRVNFKGNFCPKLFNYSYAKPVDASDPDFSAVGGGRGCKQ